MSEVSTPHSSQDDFALVRASLGAHEISEAGAALKRIEEQLRGVQAEYAHRLAQFIKLEEQLEAAERVAREAFQFDARFEERLYEKARPLNDAITAWRASSPASSHPAFLERKVGEYPPVMDDVPDPAKRPT